MKLHKKLALTAAALMVTGGVAAASVPAQAGTSPVFRARTSASGQTSSLAVPAPSGTVSGDCQVALVEVGTTSETLGATPSGWVKQQGATDAGGAGGDSYQLALYTSTTAAGSVTFTKSGTRSWQVERSAYSSCAGIGLSAIAVRAAGTSFATPSVTTTADGDVVEGAVGTEGTATGTTQSFTPPSGWTERHDADVANEDEALTAADVAVTTGGTPVSGTFTAARSDNGIAAAVVLKAVAGSQAPVVTTTAATGVTSTSATLNGSVNPEGQSTTYQFEYGTTTGYGTTIPATPGSAGSGSTAVAESATPTGLTANTTYHYRIEATNATGTTLGSDQQFTTSAAGTIQPSWAPGGSRTVALDDEFNSTSINTNLWQTGWFGTGITGPVNTSAQGCYSSSQATESGGLLRLNAIAQQNTCRGTVHPYTTGIVTSNPSALGAGKGFQFTQGAVEWRAFIPGSGSTCADWSALWTDGQNWPSTGEIDNQECLGGTVAWHLHSDAAGGASSGPGASPPGTWTGWHTFGADWTATSVTFYYDGVNVGSHAYTVNAPNYLIMVLEIPSGTVTIPAEMDVDWVHVWN